jgi:hypothetical protein
MDEFVAHNHTHHKRYIKKQENCPDLRNLNAYPDKKVLPSG